MQEDGPPQHVMKSTSQVARDTYRGGNSEPLKALEEYVHVF